jgi:uncharacterized membrane protein
MWVTSIHGNTAAWVIAVPIIVVALILLAAMYLNDRKRQRR